jgi:hypothetical protein
MMSHGDGVAADGRDYVCVVCHGGGTDGGGTGGDFAPPELMPNDADYGITNTAARCALTSTSPRSSR